MIIEPKRSDQKNHVKGEHNRRRRGNIEVAKSIDTPNGGH